MTPEWNNWFGYAFESVCYKHISTIRKALSISPEAIADSCEIHRGDIVSFCLNEPYKSLGLQRFYLEKGQLFQGAVPLIKEVIAIMKNLCV